MIPAHSPEENDRNALAASGTINKIVQVIRGNILPCRTTFYQVERHSPLLLHRHTSMSTDITVRWSVSVLVPANEAATNNIFLSIPSPTIELEVNGIATSTIITTSSNTSFPSYIYYDVTPMKQDDESRVVEETLNIVSWEMYYKPTNDTFISSSIMELMESPTLQMKKNADMREELSSNQIIEWHVL